MWHLAGPMGARLKDLYCNQTEIKVIFPSRDKSLIHQLFTLSYQFMCRLIFQIRTQYFHVLMVYNFKSVVPF